MVFLALEVAMLLRADPQFGFLSIIVLFAVVWTTDIAAYFEAASARTSAERDSSAISTCANSRITRRRFPRS